MPADGSSAGTASARGPELRRNGHVIPQIDLHIAAIALTLGNCTVITKDSDFRLISGLDIEDWSKPRVG